MDFASWQRYCTTSSRGRQPNFAALNRGGHLCSAGRPSRWALAHISSYSSICVLPNVHFRWIKIITSTVTRGHSLKLFVLQSRLDVRKYLFCHRIVHCWNSLPAQPDDFLSLNKFKRLLERVDLSGLYRVLTDRFHLNEHLCLSAPCQ